VIRATCAAGAFDAPPACVSRIAFEKEGTAWFGRAAPLSSAARARRASGRGPATRSRAKFARSLRRISNARPILIAARSRTRQHQRLTRCAAPFLSREALISRGCARSKRSGTGSSAAARRAATTCPERAASPVAAGFSRGKSGIAASACDRWSRRDPFFTRATAVRSGCEPAATGPPYGGKKCPQRDKLPPRP
jgi:hypothetical protein